MNIVQALRWVTQWHIMFVWLILISSSLKLLWKFSLWKKKKSKDKRRLPWPWLPWWIVYNLNSMQLSKFLLIKALIADANLKIPANFFHCCQLYQFTGEDWFRLANEIAKSWTKKYLCILASTIWSSLLRRDSHWVKWRTFLKWHHFHNDVDHLLVIHIDVTSISNFF